MVYLAGRKCFVPVCAEMLRQGDPVLIESRGAKPGPVFIDPGGGRSQAGHETGT